MKLAMMMAVGLAACLMEEVEGETPPPVSGGAVSPEVVPETLVEDAAAGQPAAPHLDRAAQTDPAASEASEPAVGVDTEDEYAVACASGKPIIALVGKYTDRVPVQLKDRAHLQKLQAEHGGAVEVQS